jgi:hypothetical protein
LAVHSGKIGMQSFNLHQTMSRVKQIEAEILKLSPQELSQLTDWILTIDEQQWDRQIEEDDAAGKLDFLSQEAHAEFTAGNPRTI